MGGKKSEQCAEGAAECGGGEEQRCAGTAARRRSTRLISCPAAERSAPSTVMEIRRKDSFLWGRGRCSSTPSLLLLLLLLISVLMLQNIQGSLVVEFLCWEQCCSSRQREEQLLCSGLTCVLFAPGFCSAGGLWRCSRQSRANAETQCCG